MKFSVFILLGTLALASCSKGNDSSDATSLDRDIQLITPESVKANQTNEEELLSLEARQMRDYQFELLLDDRLNLSSRILAAKTYFTTFDFQLRHNIKDQATLDILLFEATNEFAQRIPEIFDGINPKKISPFKAKNKAALSFYALAAALDESTLSISFYDVMKRALIKDKALKTLSMSEEPLVLKDTKEISLELLKARVDILTILALDNLTDKKNMTFGQKTKALIFNVTGGLLGSIDLPETYDVSNEATKIAAKDFLNQAVLTKNFLAELGIKKALNKKLHSALKKIEFKEKDDSDEKKAEIKNLIEKLLGA